MSYPKELEAFNITEKDFREEMVYVLVNPKDGRPKTRVVEVYHRDLWATTGASISRMKDVEKIIYAPEGSEPVTSKDVKGLDEKATEAVKKQAEEEEKLRQQAEDAAKKEGEAAIEKAKEDKKKKEVDVKAKKKEQSKKK